MQRPATQDLGLSPTPFPPAGTPTKLPPTDTPAPRPTPDPLRPPEDLPHYGLSAVLDYNRHTLDVEETIKYTNRTEEALDSLVLVVDANAQPGVFSLEEISWQDGSAVKTYTLEKHRLDLPLPESLAPGDQVTLQIAYTLNLPELSSALGYTELQANLIDWYPFIPPYRPGEGWLINPPWPYGEYLVYESADYTVRLQLAGEFPGLTIVAGAPAETDGDARVYRLKAARSFAWGASPYYESAATEAGEVRLTSYFYASHRVAGEAALEIAARALALYEELFGPYPHEQLSIVEASFPDGMEFDGLIFVSQGYYAEYDGTPQNFLTILAIHETAHQWWFGLVGNDQAKEPWIDEALATYSELLYYERYHPELAEWWWFFRVNFFNPQGWINGTIYDYGRFDPYFNAVYHRGAQFMQSLRDALGDGPFFAFLEQYALENRFRQVNEDTFFEDLAQSGTLDIEALKAPFFNR